MNSSNKVNPLLLEHIRKSDAGPLRSGKGCVIYTRVSSKEQAENNTSLETQKRSCEEYCVKNGYSIKKYFGGTFESAKSDERTEFERLISYVHKDRAIEAIFVYSYDRFSRSGPNAIYLSEELRKVGVRLIAVSQNVDTSTPSGQLHQGMILLFAQFDNEQRKEKCIGGMVENVRQGYWVNATPFGYTNLNRKAKARNHQYIINGEGKFLKKAFELKAQGLLTNKEIIDNLRKLGSKLHYKSFVRIISNPFYCGYVTNSLIPNEIYKGHHPSLISEEVFYKANNIISQNPLKGISKKYKVEALPLKIFAKDEISKSPFSGYKQKGIYYYKTLHVGTCVNVRASRLNDLFCEELKKFEFDEIGVSQVYDSIAAALNKKLANQIEEKVLIEEQIKELNRKSESLEVQLIEREINKELFDKYTAIYKDRMADLQQKMNIVGVSSSNLEKSMWKGLNIAANLSELWVFSDFDKKRKLQNLVFPEGILYNKQKNAVRTLRANTVFAAIPLCSASSEAKKNARAAKRGHNSRQVELQGIVS